MKMHRSFVPNLDSALLQVGNKLKIWQWHHNLLTWSHRQFFDAFLVRFSYWSKFHTNIITGSGVMAVFVCKGLTRNPEIGNALVWVFPNIWRLEQFRDTKFGTAFTISESLRENQRPPPPPFLQPYLIRVNDSQLLWVIWGESFWNLSKNGVRFFP